jgi:hypothetical protein
MLKNQILESGAPYSFACGLTRSWVSEVFAGLQSQYNELLGTDPIDASQKIYIGKEFTALMDTYRDDPSHLIYLMKHLGT